MKTECSKCGSIHAIEIPARRSRLAHLVCFACRHVDTIATKFLFDQHDDKWWTKSEWPKSNEWVVAEKDRADILDIAQAIYLARLIVM